MARAVPVTLSRWPLTRLKSFNPLDFALVFAMSLWGGNYVVSKAATDVIPPLVYNAMRFSVATCTLLIILRTRRTPLVMPRREWRPIILASLIGYVLFQPLFMNGLHNTTVGNSVLILTAGPVWVVLYNGLRRQDRITRGAVLGVVIALSGVVGVILGRYSGEVSLGGATLLGDTLMLVASLVWAWSLLASRGPLIRNDNALTTFWMMLWGALSQIVIGLPSLVSMDWSRVTGPVILGVLYSGVISVVIGSLIFNFALRKMGAARASIYSYLQPLTAATLAVLFLHEAFTPWLIIGAILIFVGVWIARLA